MTSLKHAAIAASFISAMAMASCESGADKADRQLAQLAESSTATDPSVSYQARTLTYRYTLEPGTFTRIDAENMKKKTLGELRSETNRQLVDVLTRAKASVQYVYVCGNDSIAFVFQPSDLAAE